MLNTPVECYNGIYVKREDLCVPEGAPPFSKVRGVYRHLERLREEGCRGVAYVETSVSMAGWGVAWACSHLGLHCIIYDPQYRVEPELLTFHRRQWKRWGAELRPIPAGRAKVNYYTARRDLRGQEGIKLLPLGLPFLETLEETAREATATGIEAYPSVVMCVGSGTIATGVYQAMSSSQTLYGVLCRTGDVERKRRHILNGSGKLAFDRADLKLIDPDWEYAEPCLVDVPFPCHPWYDAKAWQWLEENRDWLDKPIMFWNIGSTGGFQL